MVKNVLSTLMTDRLIAQFNWMGQRGKRPIQSCKIMKVVFSEIIYTLQLRYSFDKLILKLNNKLIDFNVCMSSKMPLFFIMT